MQNISNTKRGAVVIMLKMLKRNILFILIIPIVTAIDIGNWHTFNLNLDNQEECMFSNNYWEGEYGSWGQYYTYKAYKLIDPDGELVSYGNNQYTDMDTLFNFTHTEQLNKSGVWRYCGIVYLFEYYWSDEILSCNGIISDCFVEDCIEVIVENCTFDRFEYLVTNYYEQWLLQG